VVKPKNIELLVNGTKAQVQEELTKRGFHPDNVYSIREIKGQCEVLVSTICMPGVERWFKEVPPITSVGCLVCYQT